MSDVALFWDNHEGVADVAVAGGDLVADAGLTTAVIMSLHCDARARPDDELPDPNADPRGWWGDSYSDVPGDVTGSRLWLFKYRENTPATREAFKEAALEALAWMLTDGVAQSIDFAWYPAGVAYDVNSAPYRITITPPKGDPRRFDFVWGGQSS